MHWRISLILIFLPCLLVMNSCKKDDPVVVDPFGGISVVKKQEAFVTMTTATWCSSCGTWGIPTFDGAFEGHDSIDTTGINGLALHNSPDDSLYCILAEKMNNVFGMTGTPNLWIEFNNAFNIQPTRWIDAIRARCAQTNPVCAIGMKVKNQNGICTLYVDTRFYSAATDTLNLAIYTVENGVMAFQAGSALGYSHLHNWVLRDEVTSGEEWGTPLVTGPSAGDYKRTWFYQSGPGIDPDNIRFVAVVYKMQQGIPVASLNSNTFLSHD
jgi:hypothetical protein